jgi:DNA polymerase (family 10)
MENIEIARLLTETADLMEIAAEDSFRIRSYRNAASAIEGYPERLATILGAGRKLTDIPGIGKGISAIIEEIEKRGTFARREELVAKYPPVALEMLHIQGLGPKTIALLLEMFQLTSLDDLKRICEEQRLRSLPRLGAKLEEKVLRGIEQYRRSAGRFLLSFADQIAQELSAYLAGTDGVDKITPAGSYRRGRETVGDLDLLVTGPHATNALSRFVKHPKVREVLATDENKASARIGVEGIQVDVRTLPPESYGAAMQYFTGSKEHNVILRQRALRLGLTLNEYGLFTVEDNTRVAGVTEDEVYGKLGLDCIPPELRENQGEFEAAENHTLPDLIDLAGIRGDLHMHTKETDGRATLEEMAETGRAHGYEYIAITDHSKSLAMANGLNEERVLAFAQRVRAMDPDALGIRVLSGIECDILRSGEMDLDDEALAALDFVIASVHSHMSLDSSEMTDRYLRCLENRYVCAIGHPMGRMLLHRDGLVYQFERIAEEAARRGVAFEINASPERLDLPPALIRIAKAKGCRFTISTDAHQPRHMANMKFGVLMARRGWLTRSDILNTLPLTAFQESLRKTA